MTVVKRVVQKTLAHFGFWLARTGSYSMLADNLLARRSRLPYGSYGFNACETDFYNYYIETKNRISLIHSYSQLGQDLWIAFLLANFDPADSSVKPRFFVEFGAFDGKTLSNTYFLEKELGWTGILAEPIPKQFVVCQQNRTCAVDSRCVWTESGLTLPFNSVNGLNELGTIAAFEGRDGHSNTRASRRESIAVTTVSLKDLLDEHQAPGTIDYLSVDTEGSEYEILQSFAFKSYFVKTISVEHNYTGQRQKIERLLTKHGFFRLKRSPDYFDDIYLNRLTFDADSLSAEPARK